VLNQNGSVTVIVSFSVQIIHQSPCTLICKQQLKQLGSSLKIASIIMNANENMKCLSSISHLTIDVKVILCPILFSAIQFTSIFTSE